MNKILILSFHGENNYGAVLQNYALQTAIKDLGFQAETLNYNPYASPTDIWGHMHRGLWNKIKKFARYMQFYRKMLVRNEAFQNFRNTHLSVTDEMTKQQLPGLNGQYDVFVVGSDQVWNIRAITENEMDTYTLQFIHSGKRAAYAASAGASPNIPPRLIERISTFDFISVREHSLKERLEQSGLTDVHDVCDPTLLLEEEWWKQLVGDYRPLAKPYVFLYFLQASEIERDLRRLSKDIAAEHGLEICHVDRRSGFGVCRYGIGPIDWISSIAHAEKTVLSSFHGLAFSIIFEKEFFLIHRPSMEDRTRDLLNALGLSDRGFDSYEDYCLRKDSVRPIDWCAVKEKLAVIRKNSKSALWEICNLPESR